jgi:metal-sulfur cluster biosynthetic enzyme
MSQVFKSDVEQRLSSIRTVRQVHTEIVFDPPWTMQRMPEATRLQFGLDYKSFRSDVLTSPPKLAANSVFCSSA